MPEMRDRVEFAIPPGQLVVHRATCPRGCTLMAVDRSIHGHPSIRIRAEYEGCGGLLYLDPVYGSHDNESEIPVPENAVAELSCPGCGASLRHPDSSCADCGAPMFLLHLPGGGFVEACQRNGCHRHRLHIVTGEQVMQEMFDRIGMDAFL